MKKITDLFDFIDRAIKSRKYPENTGMSLKTALKLFEAELNDEERNSVEEFKKNLEQIYQGVFSKNKHFTANSLMTYKSRVSKVLMDYEKYGYDPTKMAHWSPKMTARSKKQSLKSDNEKVAKDSVNTLISSDSFHMFDFHGGVQLAVPKTPKMTEAIMDGELKQIRIELKAFADKNSPKD